MSRRAALVVLAVVLLAYAGWTQRTSARAGQGDAPLPDEPVLVVVVRGAAELDAVRAAIDPERVVANSLEGFAVREGRVVVTSVEAAGPLLSLVGWAEAELEIVTVAPRRPVGAAGAAGGSGATAQAGLAALYAKPTLTLDEAIRALRLLE